jgi:glycosyl transferase family 25
VREGGFVMAAPLPIFVINLARSPERRRGVQAQCDQLGLQPRFVDACDGLRLSPRDRDDASGSVRPLSGVPLTVTELGCLLSHSAVYAQIVGERLPAACILEDDCRLTPEFVRILETLDWHAWDVLLLGHHSARHDWTVGAETCYRRVRVDAGFHIARVAEFPMGAYAYVVTLGGAARLLEFARPARMPADWVVGYSPAAGVRLAAVKPPCVVPDGELSSRTTIAGRTGPASPQTSAGRLRRWVGRALLLTRKAGIRSDAYVKT